MLVDTRRKIITFEQAVNLARLQQVRWVTGTFDPLLAEHAQRLREFIEPGHILVVIVANPPRPLLSQRARAELVAALSMVDHVVMKDGPAQFSEPDDARIREEFIQHVLLKSRSHER
ncbi:MAG: hypothetical protein M3Z32_04840 [Acidobacteriota bacterium]|nr:hypothetical protein [Acidobacteriota bacterium]